MKGSLVNFICEAKSVAKQDVLIMVTWKVMQWTETMFSKLVTFPNIHWVVDTSMGLLPLITLHIHPGFEGRQRNNG